MNNDEPIIVDVTPTPEPTEHEKFAKDLRDMANFIEKNEDIPLPSSVTIQVFPNGKEGMGLVAKAMKSFEKLYCDQLIRIKKSFGRVQLEAIEMRANICERRVIGTKTVKVQKPVTFQEVEETKEIVEWDCGDPLLKQIKEVTPEKNLLP